MIPNKLLLLLLLPPDSLSSWSASSSRQVCAGVTLKRVVLTSPVTAGNEPVEPATVAKVKGSGSLWLRASCHEMAAGLRAAGCWRLKLKQQ